MKKDLKKILILILSISPTSVYAATLEMSFKNIALLISAIFVALGLGLIILPKLKSHNETNLDSKSNNQNNNQKNNKQSKVPIDLILKNFPTFSVNQFHTNIFLKIQEKFNNEEKIIITLLEKEIIDFYKKDNCYTIISKYKVKHSTNNEKQDNNIISSYTVTSQNETLPNKTITNCPTCFGKIKAPTNLRCKHCDCLLPINTQKKEQWIIKKIEIDNQNQ